MTTMVHEITFMSEGKTIPWVRVPGHDNAAIGFALDTGASIVIPQIETLKAIDNLDAILIEACYIDAVWLGTLDLRASMGLVAWGAASDEPEFLEAVEKFESILRKHDMPHGGLAIGTPEMKLALGKDNSMSFIAADVVVLGGMVGDLMATREMFPAERKMAGKAKVLANGHPHAPTSLNNEA